eukprot:6808338-Karenia_brevis.AAC.1
MTIFSLRQLVSAVPHTFPLRDSFLPVIGRPGAGMTWWSSTYCSLQLRLCLRLMLPADVVKVLVEMVHDQSVFFLRFAEPVPSYYHGEDAVIRIVVLPVVSSEHAASIYNHMIFAPNPSDDLEAWFWRMMAAAEEAEVQGVVDQRIDTVLLIAPRTARLA